jgi:hypothetical protein
MENAPALYLSKSTNSDGILMYRVIMRGLPVMSDNADLQVAFKVLLQTAAQVKTPASDKIWDGDLGKFI